MTVQTLFQRPGPRAELLLRAAHVLDPRAGLDAPHDVLVRGGQIAEIGAPGSLAAPNSVSSKRRSISYWSRATASRVAAHAGADWAEVQYLALFLIRLDARTTAGAQTATEKKPRRN